MEDFASLTKNGNVKARQMFEKAIELDSNYAAAYAMLGWNYYAGFILAFESDPNGLEQALGLEQHAVALDDSMALAHNLLGVIYVQKGQYDQAVTEAQRAIALDPNSPDGYSSLAQVLNNEVKPTEALEAVETAMRLDPRNPDKYLMDQAFAYYLLGRWKEAIPVWKSILVRFPDNIWAHAFLAGAYSNIDDADGARAETAAIERAIALSPNSALGYMALAQGLGAQGRPAEALIAADKAVRLDPRNGDNLPPIYLMYEGWAYTLLGRWDEAITAIKRHLIRSPNNFWAHTFLAVDYMELSQDDAARAEVAEAQRLDPQFNVETVFPVVSLQHKALPAEIERFRDDLRKAGLQ